MAESNHTLTPESVKPALSGLDPVRRELLWILSHLAPADQAFLVKVAEAMAGRA